MPSARRASGLQRARGSACPPTRWTDPPGPEAKDAGGSRLRPRLVFVTSAPVILKARGSRGAPGDGQVTMCGRRRSLFTLWDSGRRRPRGTEAEGGRLAEAAGERGCRHPPPQAAAGSGFQAAGVAGCGSPGIGPSAAARGLEERGGPLPAALPLGETGAPEGPGNSINLWGNPHPRSLRRRPPLPIMGLKLESRVSDGRGLGASSVSERAGATQTARPAPGAPMGAVSERRAAAWAPRGACHLRGPSR